MKFLSVMVALLTVIAVLQYWISDLNTGRIEVLEEWAFAEWDTVSVTIVPPDSVDSRYIIHCIPEEERPLVIPGGDND